MSEQAPCEKTVWDSGWMHGYREGVVAGRDNGRDEAARERLADLGSLLRALGMGDHARPESPAEVMRQAIARAAQMREALRLAEALEMRHANCMDCDGAGEPEACETCFPAADRARLARRAALGNEYAIREQGRK